MCTPTHLHSHTQAHSCIRVCVINCYIARADGAFNYLLHLCVSPVSLSVCVCVHPCVCECVSVGLAFV